MGKKILRIYVKYSREGRRKHKLGRNYVQYSGKKFRRIHLKYCGKCEGYWEDVQYSGKGRGHTED
jgi:hypothetical protein